MNEKITFLAGINTFYSADKDFIGAFADILLSIFEEDKKYSISEAKEELNQKSSLEIPIDVIRTILKRLKKDKNIDYLELKDITRKNIIITAEGKIQKATNRIELKKIERESRKLVDEIYQYLDEEFSKEIIENSFDNFIGDNLHELVNVLEGSGKLKTQEKLIQEKIANFFIKSEHENPENFKILKSILFGKVIAYSFLNFGNSNKKTKINNLDVYLDTNIIFSILGFHLESYNKPVLEMIEIFKSSGINLKIFEFTLSEVLYKLESYWEEYDNYSASVPVDSIYFTLKQKGYAKSDVIFLIENIETKLSEFGVSVDYNFQLENLLEEDSEDIFSQLSSLKTYKPAPVIQHDAAAILAIKKLRGNSRTRILEKSRYLFVTADNLLINFSQKISQNNCISQVVSSNYVTSIFWMKGFKNSGDVFIHEFLAQYSRKNMISRNLWENFIEQIRALSTRDQGNISIDEIISYKETENILLEKGEEGIREILNDTNITRQRKQITDKDKKIVEQDREIKRQHDKFKKIIKVFERQCLLFWKRFVNICILIITLVLIILFFKITSIYSLETVWEIITGTAFLLALLLTFASIYFEKDFKINHFIIKHKRQMTNGLIKKCLLRKKNKYLDQE
jgi:hypothetical protein